MKYNVHVFIKYYYYILGKHYVITDEINEMDRKNICTPFFTVMLPYIGIKNCVRTYEVGEVRN